jgi:K+-transporting ATPase KdpF subunit
MGPLLWVTDHLGLLVLSALATGLSIYLVYVMIRPERF